MVDEVLDLLSIVAGCGESYDAGLAVAVLAVDNIIGDLDMACKDGVYESLHNDGIEAECEEVVDTGLAIAIGSCDACICCSQGSGHTAGNSIQFIISDFFDFVAHFKISFSFFIF